MLDKEESVQGYCLKCREKRDMVDAQEVKLKNDRPAMQGKCAVCGTKITVIGGKKAAEKIENSDKSDNFSERISDDEKAHERTEAKQYEKDGRDPVTAKIKAESKDPKEKAKR